jgi:hypothetical protein
MIQYACACIYYGEIEKADAVDLPKNRLPTQFNCNLPDSCSVTANWTPRLHVVVISFEIFGRRRVARSFNGAANLSLDLPRWRRSSPGPNGGRLRVVLAAAGALLAGCVSTLDQFYSEIPHYNGQKLDALIDRIGYPDSQTLGARGVVYTWTPVSATQRDLRPMQAPPVGAPETPPLATRSGPEPISVHFRCTLQVDTDGTGTILHIAWDGKPGSCVP